MNFLRYRPWLVRWLYLLVFVHAVMGFICSWMADLAIFNKYHQSVLTAFWLGDIPHAGTQLHLWWLRLFGATLQNVAIVMGVLIYVGDRYRSAIVWGWLIVALVVWAPQDIYISLEANVPSHLWVDVIALVLFLPPLVALWCSDKNDRTNTPILSGRENMHTTYPPYIAAQDQVILFDGVCKFCNGWSRFIIRFDKNHHFRLCPVQSSEGQEILKWFGYPVDYFETFLLIQGNRALEKSDAFIAIISQLPFPWMLLGIVKIFPPKIRDWFYDRVALNRYKIFGKYDSCVLATADHDKRFLG